MNALFEGMCHKIKDIESEEEERFAEYTQKTGDLIQKTGAFAQPAEFAQFQGDLYAMTIACRKAGIEFDEVTSMLSTPRETKKTFLLVKPKQLLRQVISAENILGTTVYLTEFSKAPGTAALTDNVDVHNDTINAHESEAAADQSTKRDRR